MKKIAVIDNYLNDQEFEIIKNTFYNSNFPWYYNDYKSYSKNYDKKIKKFYVMTYMIFSLLILFIVTLNT